MSTVFDFKFNTEKQQGFVAENGHREANPRWRRIQSCFEKCQQGKNKFFEKESSDVGVQSNAKTMKLSSATEAKVKSLEKAVT